MATLVPALAGCSADLATQHALFLCSGAGAVDYDTGAPQNASCATAEDQADVVIVTGTALNRREAIDEKRADSGTIEARRQRTRPAAGQELWQEPQSPARGSMYVKKGEGRYVQIRGVASNPNNVTINGAQKRFYLTRVARSCAEAATPVAHTARPPRCSAYGGDRR
jgi:hypothetical protein